MKIKHLIVLSLITYHLSLITSPIGALAQPAGGFGGLQKQMKLETSQEWKDVNYVGDDQAYHTCDIYLPKKEAAAYPVVIHIYGSAWFSNNGKGMADLGTKAAGVRTEATYPAEGSHGGPQMYTAENLQKMVNFLNEVRQH